MYQTQILNLKVENEKLRCMTEGDFPPSSSEQKLRHLFMTEIAKLKDDKLKEGLRLEEEMKENKNALKTA